MQLKHTDKWLLLALSLLSGTLILFSARAKAGAKAGLLLAENTILPSLLPILILFFLIQKSSANTALIRIFGTLFYRLFKLPKAACSAVLFGLVGGYPTGALLTQALYRDGEISAQQARRILRFNVCGGAGFIITAVGTITLHTQRAGVLLFCANVLAAVLLLTVTSFFEKRDVCVADRLAAPLPFGDALSASVSASVSSILNLSAFIILFSAFNGVVPIPKLLTPLAEITNGICSGTQFSLPLTAAFLAFGGFCIHMQLVPVIKEVQMRYLDFFIFRVISAALSYGICYVLVLLFPTQSAVFSNASKPVTALSSANIALSVLMVMGCVVLLFDLQAKHRKA